MLKGFIEVQFLDEKYRILEFLEVKQNFVLMGYGYWTSYVTTKPYRHLTLFNQIRRKEERGMNKMKTRL